MQLLERFKSAAFAQKVRAGRDVLPAQKPRYELRGVDRLDFAAKLAEREAVDARENAALAEFDFARGVAGELTAKNRASRFEAEKSSFDFFCLALEIAG